MHYEFELLRNGYTICGKNWGQVNETAIFYRMYYVYGGEAYFEQNGNVVQLRKGHLYVFPLFYPYSLYHNKDNPFKVLWFHIDIKTELYKEFIDIPIKEGNILYLLLESIKKLTDQSEYFNELLQLFDVFLFMLNQEVPFHQIDSHRLQAVIEYIEKNIGKDLNVSMLSEYVGMDRSYFSRKFKKILNMSPNQYMIAKKMNAAAIELVNGASVYQAAMAAGYTDEKAFSRAFKKYMELPPAQYRKSHIVQP